MDKLEIKALSVMTHIGVYAWEQKILQRLLIDITIPVDLSACNEELDKTIDYDKLCQTVSAFLASNSFQLIETVANRIAQLIKEEFNVAEITVSVSKPQAVKNAANVSVTVTR